MADDTGFAAFARRVAEDTDLVRVLRPLSDRDAFVAAAVSEGVARGFRFGAADVEAAMHGNRQGWLMHPQPMLPIGGAA